MRIHEMKSTEDRHAEFVDGMTKIRDVVDRLTRRACGAVIVRDDGSTLDAVLTEGDVIREMARHGSDALDMTAASVAVTATASCAPGDYVTDVARLMTDRGLSYLPIREDGRVVDIVGLGEILRQRIADRRRATRAVFGSMSSLRISA